MAAHYAYLNPGTPYEAKVLLPDFMYAYLAGCAGYPGWVGMSELEVRHWTDGHRSFVASQNRPDPVKQFHIDRGCCDGTDINACTIARAAAETERSRKAKGRPREDDEYAGTEPSE